LHNQFILRIFLFIKRIMLTGSLDMKLPFINRRKKAPEESTKTEEVTEKIVSEDVPKEPTSAERSEQIIDLISRITNEQAGGVQEVKFLTKAFVKAANAVLNDPSLASEKTFKAFINYASSVTDPDLRYEAISRVGSLAKKYSDHSEVALGTLSDAITDADEDVRHIAMHSLKDMAVTNEKISQKVFDIFEGAIKSPYRNVRDNAVMGLTALAVNDNKFSKNAIELLTQTIKEGPGDNPSAQLYKVRIQASKRLGEIALTNEDNASLTLEGLNTALYDEDLFVRYRAIESLTGIADQYDESKETILEMLKDAQKGTIFVVKQKIDSAILHIDPPPEPVKSPEQIEAERKEAEERQKAIEEQRKKQAEIEKQKALAESEKKARMEDIKNIANALPGPAIK
jgi:hypothetical protein